MKGKVGRAVPLQSSKASPEAFNNLWIGWLGSMVVSGSWTCTCAVSATLRSASVLGKAPERCIRHSFRSAMLVDVGRGVVPVLLLFFAFSLVQFAVYSWTL